MSDFVAAKLIAASSPRCKWVCSWSNYYSAWSVDGKLMIYSKVHRTAELWSEIPQRKNNLFSNPPKRMSKDPRMEEHLAEIAKP